MPALITLSPGTVSKILWHFTGGPIWNADQKRQNKHRKPARQAYGNLTSILRARELRVGQYTEVVKVLAPEPKFDEKGRLEDMQNVSVELTSAPLCCLADIPVAHLGYHARRYGKFAIGFHRDAVIRHDFNPVFYTLQDTRIIQSIYAGFKKLLYVYDNFDTLRSVVPSVASLVSGSEAAEDIGLIHFDTLEIEHYVKSAERNFKEFLAFVKTFQRDEFGSIYCEREWRSLKGYSFTFDDVAMIVLPKRVGHYFSDFVGRVANKLDLPRSIPIVPWEDLVEH
jgi:hypothetical protein